MSVHGLLTDLGEHSADDALDEDQCPGKRELLLTIVAPSAARSQRRTEKMNVTPERPSSSSRTETHVVRRRFNCKSLFFVFVFLQNTCVNERNGEGTGSRDKEGGGF